MLKCEPDPIYDEKPDGVGRSSDKGFDPQVLSDGFEEQLDLPDLAIDPGAKIGAEVEVVNLAWWKPTIVGPTTKK